MLQSIDKITSSLGNLKRDLSQYQLSDISNVAVYSRVKKAFLSAAAHIKTDQELTDCKVQFYGSMQKLKRLGIDLNDLDCWFINIYKSKIEAQYQYQALLRSAANKGYTCLPTIYYLLPEEVGIDQQTGKPKNFHTKRDENDIIRIHYINTGLKKNINLDTIKDFHSFFILMNIKHKGRLIHQEELFLSPEEILERKDKSKTKDSGTEVWDYKEKKYVKKEDKSVWEQWTRQQIDKTLVWAAMKMVKESLPALHEILEFEDFEDEEEIQGQSEKTENTQEEIVINKDVDLSSPPPEVLQEAEKIKSEYKLTPEFKEYNRDLLNKRLTVCKDDVEKQHFINTNAHIIFSLDDEIRDNFIKKINDTEEAK